MKFKTEEVKSSYDSFQAFVDSTFDEYKDIQRYGQYWFNCLYYLRADLADSIRGTSYDPFYRDSVSDIIKQSISEKW